MIKKGFRFVFLLFAVFSFLLSCGRKETSLSENIEYPSKELTKEQRILTSRLLGSWMSVKYEVSKKDSHGDTEQESFNTTQDAIIYRYYKDAKENLKLSVSFKDPSTGKKTEVEASDLEISKDGKKIGIMSATSNGKEKLLAFEEEVFKISQDSLVVSSRDPSGSTYFRHCVSFQN